MQSKSLLFIALFLKIQVRTKANKLSGKIDGVMQFVINLWPSSRFRYSNYASSYKSSIETFSVLVTITIQELMN
jgi:hypothetical protein